MNFLKKYLLLLLILISTGNFGFAQQREKTEAVGEIVMTKAELTSFLDKIAALKKQQIERKQNELKSEAVDMEGELKTISNKVSSDRPIEFKEDTYTESRKDLTNREVNRLYAELDNINYRIEYLIRHIEDMQGVIYSNQAMTSPINQEPVASQQRLRPTTNETQQQPIIIQQPAPSPVYLQPVQREIVRDNRRSPISRQNERPIIIQQLPQQPRSENLERQNQNLQYDQSDSVRASWRNEELKLRNRIQGLEQEIRLLNELSKFSEKDEKRKYEEDIAKLKTNIGDLNTEMENKKNEEAKKLNNVSNKLNELSDHSFHIYFANNSAIIPDSNYFHLRQVVNMVENNSELMVVLKGFASPLGNSQYNQKLSLERANVVKKWLLNNGLKSQNIITSQQGVDNANDASKARRVELDLLTQ